MLHRMTRANTYTIPLHASNAGTETAQTRAARLQARYAHLDGAELIRAILAEEDSGRVAVVSSFGTESAVLLHMLARVAPHTPVLFIDTGKLFRETLDYADDLTQSLGLSDVRRIRPKPHDVRSADPDGRLWERESHGCCHLRKTVPLRRALQRFDLWITGRKRYQAETRAGLALFEPDGRHVKANPLAPWRADDVEIYRDVNELPEHPLEAEGYPSVGCAPCTTPVAPGEHLRAGRWRGRARTECGIHIAANSG